jgi:hypothetical protein
VKLSVTVKNGQEIRLPVCSEQLFAGSNIEWVKNSPVDTLNDGENVTYRQIFTVTSFDEGDYYFPSLPVCGSDSLILGYSDSLAFHVQSIAVDTTAAIRDIKPIARVPITFKEILPYALIVLGGAAIVLALIFLIVKYGVKKKSNKPETKKPKNRARADVVALNALDALWHKKLWQEGLLKPYYSELTEILRVYLEDRFDIYAMEMVSNDILREVEKEEVADAVALAKLRDILYNADLVKFAKWNPQPNAHEKCYKDARDFVTMTASTENTELNMKEKS